MTDISRVAVVTGAAKGIGAATALRLATDGNAVGVVDRPDTDASATVADIEAAGGRAIAVAADVTDRAALTAAVHRVAAELGTISILVNNAGYSHDLPVAEMTFQQWSDMTAIHLDAAFCTTQAVHDGMVEQGFGRIINTSSTSALGTAGRVGYSAAKSGVIGYTKALALELGPAGITANVVAPGFIVSDMTAKTARRLGRSFDEHQEINAADIPVRRVGRPEDIAHTTSFLASDGAGYVTGQVIYVAGGPRG
ncbi:3-oxoacyl-[acyl-carrier protein] reductase [Stackebrandtia endophytica]|uniref:3-oxoacyl-[acyl-carrier protein] reductase n=1 Tax=Stackebrandtia endophytica TaxID=1496996 RepID=A0A543AT30_9ACTN|nr:SDR family oxidoreductase [Stackebrandtia endophytica]TQL75716.1 3-oxoacyl-[acyl-carrier protein] reductase [Stackebrandtia endophytica]